MTKTEKPKRKSIFRIIKLALADFFGTLGFIISWIFFLIHAVVFFICELADIVKHAVVRWWDNLINETPDKGNRL